MLDLAIHQAAKRTRRSVAHTKLVMTRAAQLILERQAKACLAEAKKLGRKR